ncbi:MAG: hypothetical protein A2Y33_08310 [Spirochaetes bacterium GWF1_51_8]|nr:MAG: hypothetical protein A2Y33_08310 [Spirochaetes bacterium GWF1_51_8]
MTKFKVLAVEDAVFYTMIYKKILNPGQFELKTLAKGEGFLPLVREFIPDLILMDVNLPDASGLDLCKMVHSEPGLSEIPVIMVTSEEDIEVLKTAYRAGAADFIKKPFNAIELLIRIENVLKLSKRSMELVRIKQDTTVSEMGRAIAHNFNQPLTALMGSAEMIVMMKEKKSLDQDVVDLMDSIIEAAQSISELVDKVENLKEYRVQDYIQDVKIIDIEP